MSFYSLLTLAFILFINGCDLKGRADCRFADAIETWTETTTGRPDTVNLDNNGDASFAGNDFYAMYVCNGEPIENGGMEIGIKQFVSVYYAGYYYSGIYYPSSFLGYDFSGETGEDGTAKISLFRNDWSWRDCHPHQCSLGIKHPTRTGIENTVVAGFMNTYDPTKERDLLQYMSTKTINSTTYYGGYYHSGTQPIARKTSALASNDRYGTCPAPQNPPALPDFGIVKALCGWVREKSGGKIASVANLAAVMTCDPNRLSAMNPYRFQAIVRCAEPVEALGVELTGICKIIHPSGIVLQYPMKSTVEQDGEYLAIRSQGIITVEPSAYPLIDGIRIIPDPYWLNGKLIVPVKLNLLGSPGTSVEYEITGIDKNSLVPILAKYWLSSNRTLDVNQDGIVNLKDLNN